MNRKPKMRRCLQRISDKILLSRSLRLDVGWKVAGSRVTFLICCEVFMQYVSKKACTSEVEGPGIIETHDIFSMSNSVFTDFLNIT